MVPCTGEKKERENMYNPVFHVTMELFTNPQLPLMDCFSSLAGNVPLLQILPGIEPYLF